MMEENTVSVWGGCFSPFRLVTFDDEDWLATIEEINTSSYETTRLFRTTLNIDVGIAPLSLIVSFDGTLILPVCVDITKKCALTIFNKHLTDLLLGGLLVEEVAPDDVTLGSLNFWGYHRHHCPSGRYSKLSQNLRAGRAGNDETIILFEPKRISKNQYLSHHSTGIALSRKLPGNFSTVFLPACTSYINESWERSLILAWASIELIVEQMWKFHVIEGRKVPGITKKRRKSFLSDTRTWSSSTRIELLWQQGYIADKVYSLADKARSARNSFIHSASECSPEAARSAIEALLYMIQSVALKSELSFNAESLLNLLDESTPYFQTPIADESGRLLQEPKLWRYPDPAPGFKDWGDRPFEKVPEIELQPLQKEGEN